MAVRRLGSTFITALLACSAAWAFGTEPTGGDRPRSKKLIEFGWDEPDTSFMRAHVAEMERWPFQGCVFHMNYRRENGKVNGPFMSEGWGRHAFKIEQMQPAIDDLKATPFHRFTDNFLRFNTTPGDLDWFDDYSAVTNNAKLAAHVAREGGCRGVLLDIEQYVHPLFNYRKQRDAGSKSWDQYAAQARLRGREVMDAFQHEFPGLTVFLTFGYSLPMAESNGDKAKLAECNYGLLAPYLDGMLDAAEGGTRIVDGCELSYGYRDVARFAREREVIKQGALKIAADPSKYPHVFSAGFGIWMDEDWRKNGWDLADFSKNFYTPEAFEQSLRAALQSADEYVWVYTEQPRWWSIADARPEKLPAAYEQALRRAAPVGGKGEP